MRRTLLYMILGMMAVLPATAQVQFRTAELQRLATALQIDTATLPEGYSHPTANGLHLTVYVSGQTVSHIGLHLFNDELRAIGSSPVFDFLERYFLQLKYPPTVKTAQNMTRDDKFRFTTGTLATIDAVRPTDDFAFSNDNHHYTATWSRDGQPLLAVSSPVEYELISGENKIEAEENLQADIQNTSVSASPLPQDDASRNDHYLDDSFSNHLYFRRGKLVASSQHPAETAANIMLSTHTKGAYDISVTQISYGFRKKVFQIPLNKWITFCRNSGCQLYFGVENIEANGDISAVVLAVNEAENYNHVLTVSITADAIARHEGTLEARLYPYVPTHNVVNMFATYRKSSPKTFVSR